MYLNLGAEAIVAEIDPILPLKRVFSPRILSLLPKENAWNYWRAKFDAEASLKDAIADQKVDIDEEFNDYNNFLVNDRIEILQAHEDFFQALNNGNLEVMKSLWLAARKTLCLPVNDPQFD